MRIIGYSFLSVVVIVYILCCALVARAVLSELFSAYPGLLKKERAGIVILTWLCLVFFPITIPLITILQKTRQKGRKEQTRILANRRNIVKDKT